MNPRDFSSEGAVTEGAGCFFFARGGTETAAARSGASATASWIGGSRRSRIGIGSGIPLPANRTSNRSLHPGQRTRMPSLMLRSQRDVRRNRGSATSGRMA